MEKELEKRQMLEMMEGEKRQEEEKKLLMMEEKHKDHPKMHHPVSPVCGGRVVGLFCPAFVCLLAFVTFLSRFLNVSRHFTSRIKAIFKHTMYHVAMILIIPASVFYEII